MLSRYNILYNFYRTAIIILLCSLLNLSDCFVEVSGCIQKQMGIVRCMTPICFCVRIYFICVVEMWWLYFFVS